MSDTIIIKNLGPIEEVEIERAPLTVLVGKQASGKSLVAQVSFFFCSIHSLVARYYSPQLVEESKWQEKLIKNILDDLRGVPFGYFADGTAYLHYKTEKSWWSVHVYKSNRNVRLNKAFKDYLTQLVKTWEKEQNKGKLKYAWDFQNIFIPTERSVFTRLSDKAPTVLYAQHQPILLRLFAEYLDRSKSIYSKLYAKVGRKELADVFGREWLESMDYVLEQQVKAIQGKAYTPPHGPQLWKWMIHSGDEKKRIIPIEATASGQMEAWPFFVIAATMGSIFPQMSVYFEEPETHLHPAALVEVMRTIAYLVGRGQSFFLTTHSPYILYVINNMLQGHLARMADGQGRITLDPAAVAVYQIDDGTKSLIDRKETGLIEVGELERVADELGEEFEALLDEMDRT
jgi:hypothetical protein